MPETKIDLVTPCGTCYHIYGIHYRTHGDGAAGCKDTVGRSAPIPCPCEGFMLTQSETLREAFHHAVGMATYDAVVARQDRKYARLYIKEHFADNAPNDGHGEP